MKLRSNGNYAHAIILVKNYNISVISHENIRGCNSDLTCLIAWKIMRNPQICQTLHRRANLLDHLESRLSEYGRPFTAYLTCSHPKGLREAISCRCRFTYQYEANEYRNWDSLL